MTRLREEKIARIADDVAPAEVFGDASGDLLLVGWGGTHGALHAATLRLQERGTKASHLHLRHLNPMPKNVGPVLKSFKKVLVAELNRGQRALWILTADGSFGDGAREHLLLSTLRLWSAESVQVPPVDEWSVSLDSSGRSGGRKPLRDACSS